MAPLPRQAFPLILLLAAAAPAAAQTVDAAKLRESQAAVEKAGLPLYKLIDASDQGMQWSPRNIADLGPAIQAASRAVEELHQKFPSAVADAYGNGTMTNIEDTFKLFGGGSLERGCLSHQAATYDAVRPVLANGSLEVHKVRINATVAFPHNAVVVVPKGKDYRKSGVVFDGWKRQKSAPDKMTYLFADWQGALDVKPRLVDDE